MALSGTSLVICSFFLKKAPERVDIEGATLLFINLLFYLAVYTLSISSIDSAYILISFNRIVNRNSIFNIHDITLSVRLQNHQCVAPKKTKVSLQLEPVGQVKHCLHLTDLSRFPNPYMSQ